MRSDDLSRREVACGAVAALALAGAAIPGAMRPRKALAGGDDDRALVESAIAAQQTAAVAYGTAADSGALSKPLVDMTTLFGRQARAQAAALARELPALEGERPALPRPEDLKGLEELRSEADYLGFAIRLENAAVRRCVEALQGLGTATPLETVARVMGATGQRLVILRQALSADPGDWAPDAFETGTSPPPA